MRIKLISIAMILLLSGCTGLCSAIGTVGHPVGVLLPKDDTQINQNNNLPQVKTYTVLTF
jgi:hypothetical protein